MSSPMRVLQIMRAPVGGLFRHVADLTEALAQKGHQVGLVIDSLASDAQTESRIANLGQFAELGVHRLPMPRVLGLNDLVTPLRIRTLAQELTVNILHGHGAKGGFGARLARVGNRKTSALYTPHGGVLHFDAKSPSGAVFMTIERQLLKVSDAIIFESAYGQRTFEQKIASPHCVTKVIHNGLRPSEFEPAPTDPDAAEFVFVGELRELKGIDVLIDALAQLDHPARLVMAGDGPDADALRAQISAKQLQSRVTLVGVQPAREMFRRGQCLVVPSRAESLPYIVLEAAAAGCPMIATDVGGINEIFGPTASRLIKPDSVAALAAAMQNWLDAPALLRADATQRRDYVGQTFTIGRMSDEIEALYRQLLAA